MDFVHFSKCYTVISLMLLTMDEKLSYILTSTGISLKKIVEMGIDVLKM